MSKEEIKMPHCLYIEIFLSETRIITNKKIFICKPKRIFVNLGDKHCDLEKLLGNSYLID